MLALGVSLWGQLGVPLLFLVFWLVLFSLRLSAFLASSGSAVAQQGLLFVLLSRWVLAVLGLPPSWPQNEEEDEEGEGGGR